MNLSMNVRQDAVRVIIVQNRRTVIKIVKATMIACILPVAVTAIALRISFVKETKALVIHATIILSAAHEYVSNTSALLRHKTTGRNKY